VRVVGIGQRWLTATRVELGPTIEAAVLGGPCRTFGGERLDVLGLTGRTDDRRGHVAGLVSHWCSPRVGRHGRMVVSLMAALFLTRWTPPTVVASQPAYEIL
jgi:hypothetical protein